MLVYECRKAYVLYLQVDLLTKEELDLPIMDNEEDEGQPKELPLELKAFKDVFSKALAKELLVLKGAKHTIEL